MSDFWNTHLFIFFICFSMCYNENILHMEKGIYGRNFMNSLFSMDGPIYRFCNFISDLFILNLFWMIFSLPIVTIGASTTALFYVWGKWLRKDNVYLFKDFWKSFKENFKQATIIWIILLCLFAIVGFNIRNMNLLGSNMNWLLVLQIALLLQLIIITVYIFPVLSRFNMNITNCFKTSFFFGGRHFITTILSVITFVIVLYITYLTGFLVLFSMSIYALISSYMMEKVFKKYIT